MANVIHFDTISYIVFLGRICMEAWIASKAPEADEKVEELLNRCKASIDMSKENPETILALHSTAVKACVHSGKHQVGGDSIPRGIRIFADLLRTGTADHATFAHVFLLCGRMPDERQKELLLPKLMAECQKVGQLSPFALGTFLRAASPQTAAKVLNVPKGMVSKMTIKDLPYRWRRNVVD